VAGELAKLGAPALPALRAHEAKAVGQAKVALASVIRRLENRQKLDQRLDSVPTVTLDVRDAEVEKVVAEMARQTSLDISGFMLDSSMRVTLKCDRTPVWKAVDDLCRAHGRLGTEYQRTSITVAGGSVGGTPVSLQRGMGVHFLPPTRAGEGHLVLQATLSYPPGLPLWSSKLHFDEIADDQGTELSAHYESEDHSTEITVGDKGPIGRFCTKLSHVSAAKVTEKSVRLQRIRGRVEAQVVLDTRTILSVEPEEESISVEGGGYKLTIAPYWAGVMSRLKVSIGQGSDDELGSFGFEAGSKRSFAFRDDLGELHFARTKSMVVGVYGLLVEAAIPKGRKVARFEVVEVAEFEEIRIPFAYADVPLK
jgi:hypothetical protein